MFFLLLLHELGHLLFLCLFKRKINYIKLYPFGAIIDYEEKANDFSYKSIIIALGGILVNSVLLLILPLLHNKTLFSANLFMLLVNLLPIFPLDGGRLFGYLLSQFVPYRYAKKFLYLFSLVIVAILFIYSLFSFKKIYLLLIASALLKINWQKWRKISYEYWQFATEKYLYPNSRLPKKKTKFWTKLPFLSLFFGKNTIFDYDSFCVDEKTILAQYLKSDSAIKKKML